MPPFPTLMIPYNDVEVGIVLITLAVFGSTSTEPPVANKISLFGPPNTSPVTEPNGNLVMIDAADVLEIYNKIHFYK